MSSSLEGTCALTHLGAIRAHGEEAARFLHSQLTQDTVLMRPDEARLAAFCTAKGRMLASFVVVARDPQDFLLVTARDLLPPTLKRLSMFVLRSKVKLTDATADVDLVGLAGSAAAPSEGLAPWQKREAGPAQVVRLYPADGVPRALWIAPPGTPAPAGATLTADDWAWGEVRSGIAPVTAATVEAFVPQMLNYESVGGVNFKKGCYPGQEVVARSQFRGTLKRRAFLVHAEGVLRAGQEVFHGGDPEQPAGQVALAAPAPGGGFDAIVAIQLSATQGGQLTAGSVDGPALTLLPLPYALLADI
ncbi:YgfZ/GcvT domain-containing protein [Ramlibacter sp. MMS24-I3-19]|uniref:CAF17-like 4Fe-4S cluster assembly/insertion protein YgfZ n=1 Tax=Ramlibacter sp. MMS24-I3-19 TaxID=3416606 RepID=UPI003CFBF219